MRMPSEIFSFLQSQVNLQAAAHQQNISQEELSGYKNGVFDALMSEYSLQKNNQNVNVNLDTLNPESTRQLLTFTGGSVKSIPLMTVNFSDGSSESVNESDKQITEDVQPSKQLRESGKWTDIFSGNKRLNDVPVKRTENVVIQNDFDEGVYAVADHAGDFVDTDVPAENAMPRPETENSVNVQPETQIQPQNDNPDNIVIEHETDTVPESTLKPSEPAERSETESPVTDKAKPEVPEPDPKHETVTPERTPELETREHESAMAATPENDKAEPDPEPEAVKPEISETHEPVKTDGKQLNPETSKTAKTESDGSDESQTLKPSEHDSAKSDNVKHDTPKAETKTHIKHEQPKNASVTERFDVNKPETDPEPINREPERNDISTEININAENADIPASPEPSRKIESSNFTVNDSRTETEPREDTAVEIREVTPDNIIVSGLAASQVNPQPLANETQLHDDPDSPSPKTSGNVHARSTRKSQAVNQTAIDGTQADSHETARTTQNSEPDTEAINRETDAPETQHSVVPEKNTAESSASAPKNNVRVSASSARNAGTPERSSGTLRRTEAHTDFRTFFDGVIGTRRTASRVNAQPLSLRTDTYDSTGIQSQAHTMRNGIVNVVRFIRADGVHKANIVIDPPALGRISVELSSGTAGVEASVKVASEQIRQIVQNQIIQLRDNLLQQGVQVSEFTVDVQQDNTGQGNNPGGREQNQGGTYGFSGTDADDETEDFRIDLEEGLLYWVA